MLDMTEKQIRDRLRFLSDNMDKLWEKISPQLKEFDALRIEFEGLYEELDKRGIFDAPLSREDAGTSSQ